MMVQSLGWENLLEWQLTPVFLAGESYGHRNLSTYSTLGCKELDTSEAI